MKTVTDSKLKALLASALIVCSAGLFSTVHAAQKGRVATKTYTVPGSVIVSHAKRHGYEFDAPFQTMFSNCEFMGMHWTAPPKQKCTVVGLHSTKSKCKNLRRGWKIKTMRMSGPASWRTRPVNTTEPFFDLNINNTGTKVKAVQIRDMTLIGPSGPANHWQEAFTHCSQSSYR